MVMEFQRHGGNMNSTSGGGGEGGGGAECFGISKATGGVQTDAACDRV